MVVLRLNFTDNGQAKYGSQSTPNQHNPGMPHFSPNIIFRLLADRQGAQQFALPALS
jgi:hypothetical protein